MTTLKPNQMVLIIASFFSLYLNDWCGALTAKELALAKCKADEKGIYDSLSFPPS